MCGGASTLGGEPRSGELKIFLPPILDYKLGDAAKSLWGRGGFRPSNTLEVKFKSTFGGFGYLVGFQKLLELGRIFLDG